MPLSLFPDDLELDELESDSGLSLPLRPEVSREPPETISVVLTPRILGEREIRPAVHEMLRQETPGHLVLNEQGLIRSRKRIDVAAWSLETCVGVEIKSQLDGLGRLRDQAEIYQGIFDELILVASTGHLKRALEWLPEWWGAWEVSTDGDRVVLTRVRRRGKNPRDSWGWRRYMVGMLWNEDLKRELRKRGLALGGWKRQLEDRLLEALGDEELKKMVREQVIKRRGPIRQ